MAGIPWVRKQDVFLVDAISVIFVLGGNHKMILISHLIWSTATAGGAVSWFDIQGKNPVVYMCKGIEKKKKQPQSQALAQTEDEEPDE